MKLKEKLLKYRFFKNLLKVKLGIKLILRKSKVAENIYDRKSFNSFKELINDESYIYEKEIEILHHLIKEGNTVFDIGANRGEYSYYLSKIVGKEGMVHAFEPGTRVFSLLEKITGTFCLKNIKINKIALSNEKGSSVLVVPYFNRQSQIQNQNSIKGRREIIYTDTLDSYCEQNQIKDIQLIKCDTEGSEMLVFRGGEKSIAKFKPIVLVEIADLHTERFGFCSNDIVNYFNNLGYSLFYYDYVEKKLIRQKEIIFKQDGHVWSKITDDLSNNNYLFIPSEKQEFYKEMI